MSITNVIQIDGFRAASGGWVDVEAEAVDEAHGSGETDVLVVLAAEQLERASGGAVRAAPHRVVAAAAERLSLVYELRLPGVP